MSEAALFQPGEVVGGAHGVGKVVGIGRQAAGGTSFDALTVQFESPKVLLHVPLERLRASGLRRVGGADGQIDRAMAALKRRPMIARRPWVARAHTYEAKVNSADLTAVAEVVRDLHHSAARSNGERSLYDRALDRMASELAAVEGISRAEAAARIVAALKGALALER